MSQTAARRRDINQAGFARLRSSASCNYCRSRRQKCSGERPTCARCRESNRECVYERRNEGSARRSSSVALEPTPTPSKPPVSPGKALRRSPSSAGEALTSDANFSLQNKAIIRPLVDTFFREISPLRCFGFIHESSFVQRMDQVFDQDEHDPLLISVCALATKAINQESLREVGTSWAKMALQIVFSNIHRMSVNILMCIVLLHEHFARIDELRTCFVLTSIACRICQGLQLNVEYDLDYSCETSDLSATEKETRRRLMWACYIMDILTAVGVEQLRLLREEHIEIQLPSDEESFFYRTPGPTSYLQPIGQLGLPTDLSGTQNSSRTLVGHRAFYLQIIVHRERSLHYLKRSIPEEDPSRPMSEFNMLVYDLEGWKNSLPANLQLNSDVIYVRKPLGMMSALLEIHMAYHQAACDLYRAMTPALLMPPRQQNSMTATAPLDFLQRGLRKWFDHACELTRIFQLALEHVPESMTQPGSAYFGYTAIRAKLYYLFYIMSNEEREAQAPVVEQLVCIDLEYVRMLRKFHPVVARVLACSEELVRTLDPVDGGAAAAAAGKSKEASLRTQHDGVAPDLPPSARQVSADHRLHPLAIFRIIRNDIEEKHTPEKTYNATIPTSTQKAPLLTASADSQWFDAMWNLDETSYAWVNANTQPGDATLLM